MEMKPTDVCTVRGLLLFTTLCIPTQPYGLRYRTAAIWEIAADDINHRVPGRA
jgi:hypothetical protein